MGIEWKEEPIKAWGDATKSVGVRWTHVVDYGLVDAYGRAIGGVVTIRRYDDEGARSLAKDGVDEFRVHIHATRDGQSFGASPNDARVATLEDAKRLAEKKIADQRKRFERAVAKGVGRQFRKAVAS